MTRAEGLERYATLQQELTTLLLLLANDDPDPEAIDACHARIDEAMQGLDALHPAADATESLLAAATETDRLARATAAAAAEGRSVLAAQQAQWERQQEAVSAYRPLTSLVEARFIDRHG